MISPSKHARCAAVALFGATLLCWPIPLCAGAAAAGQVEPAKRDTTVVPDTNASRSGLVPERPPADDASSKAAALRDTVTVQDALYARPFVASAVRTAIGGYVEGNTNYFVEDGITDGFSMELRRFNVFLFSSISPRVRLISELEFEHGTEEIALETALIDVQISPVLVLRGGILLPPIGAFNQNHDAPLWEFVDRPIVSTDIIPSTLSEVGFGAHGKWFGGPVGVTYDLYLTNGLGEGVVMNDEGRTHLASGRHDGIFGEDNNGSPAVSGRLAVLKRGLAEVGASFYTGVYTTHHAEGEQVDAARRVTLLALDYSANVAAAAIRGEVALARIDVQDDLDELFGERQWGGHLDVVFPLWRPRLRMYDGAVLNVVLRLEAVDFNAGTFRSTGQKIYDQLYAVVPGISFRPSADTVFRANYRRQWYRDFFGNAAVHTGGVQVGLATYF